MTRSKPAPSCLLQTLQIFPPKTLRWRRSPVWTDVIGVIAHARGDYTIFGGKIFQKYTLNPILISLFFLIFAFPYCSTQVRIVTQQFMPAKHFKINEKYYFVIYRNMLFGQTSGKSEVVWATELYTTQWYNTECLSVFHVKKLLHVTKLVVARAIWPLKFSKTIMQQN
jgi:Na+-translocating ferredoxin:NAD+ oxidoreductase RnfD subunit